MSFWWLFGPLGVLEGSLGVLVSPWGRQGVPGGLVGESREVPEGPQESLGSALGAAWETLGVTLGSLGSPLGLPGGLLGRFRGQKSVEQLKSIDL